MDLVDGPKERDILVPISNVRLVVDPKSALFVSGSVLDYSEDLQRAVLKSLTRTPSRTALAAKVSRFSSKTNTHVVSGADGAFASIKYKVACRS